MIDLAELERLLPCADDPAFISAFRQAKRAAKLRFADWLRRWSGHEIDPDSIFDCQIKRIHDYKRQLLNILHVIVLYNRLRHDPHQARAYARLIDWPRAQRYIGRLNIH